MNPLHFTLPSGGRAKIAVEALATLDRHRQHAPDATEAGGFLLGRMMLDSDDVVVDAATEPGLLDVRSRFRFDLLDLAHHQRHVDAAWLRSDGTCCPLGHWHTHAEPDPTPSRVDLDGWRERLRSDASDRFPLLLFVIVGTERVRAWQGDRRSMSIRQAPAADSGQLASPQPPEITP